jgi:hypothetical protein
MQDPDRARVPALIASAERDEPGGRDGLAHALHRWCWPGGGDRTEPVARGWVRRWGPNLLGEVAFDCTCTAGRCTLCN